jgi:hypothetical protein
MRRQLLTALLGAVLALSAIQPSSAAQPSGTDALPSEAPLYQVEVVIFRAAVTGAQEDWGTAPIGRGFGAPLGSSAQSPEMVRTLSPSDYRLEGIARGLRDSGSWRLIAHVAWVQTAPAWGSRTGIPLSALGIDAPGLSGTAYLERAKLYLHLGFDVTLLQDGASYRIDEMRNVRSNEKQYYDHPAFGIIAAAYPIKRADH